MKRLAVIAATVAWAPAFAQGPEIDVLNTDREAMRQEREINDGVAEALRRHDRGAAGRSLRPLSPREAVLAALQKNITVRRTELLPAMAEEALREAQAVFDPTINLSLITNRSSSYNRASYALRYKSGTIEVSPGVDNCPSGTNTTPCYRIYFGDTSAVRYIEYDQPRAAGYYLSEVEANTSSADSGAITGSTTANVTQILPWGTQLDLGLELKYQDAYWINNQDSPQETSGAYNRAWAADSSFALTTPLPYSKSFGIGNDYRLTRDLARMEGEAQRWQLQAVLNETLETVDLAFWSLAGAARRVDSARRSLALAEQLAGRMERLFRHQSITTADRNLFRAQVERTRTTLTSALGDYMTASNELQRLIRLPDKELLQPVGYSRLLDETRPLPPAEAVADNPQLLRNAVAVRQARLMEAARERQTNPDVNAYVSFSGKQSDSAFGFSTPDQAIGRLHQPDYVTLGAAVATRYPVGNRLAEAARDRAVADREINELEGQQLALEIRQTYVAAQASLDAARERVAILERQQALAEDVLKRAERLFEMRQAKAVEVSQKMLDVLDTSLALDEARMAVKQAETRALGAAGLLPALYGAHTSVTAVDDTRLRQLAKAHPMRFFGVAP